MAGDASAGGSSISRRPRPVLFVAVVAAGAIVILAGTWYDLSTQAHAEAKSSKTPPRILNIITSPSSGDSDTAFSFTAQVVDAEDSVRAIQVRWAWANASVPDTSWSANKTGTHVFGTPGDYIVRCEAKDADGMTANRTTRVHVIQRAMRIGTLLSVTGALQLFGVGEQNAVDMAIAEINAAGGVAGIPVQAFHEDDQTYVPAATAAAQKLIDQDRVDVIIGSTFSAGTLSVLPLAKAKGVFVISPSATSPSLSDLSTTGGWFARTISSDALQAVVGARYARVNLSYSYAGAIGTDDSYGRALSAAFSENFTRIGGTVTAGSPRAISPYATDYTADLHAVLDVTPIPQIVYLAAFPAQGGVLLSNWKAGIGANPAWASVRWLLSEGLDDQGFINQLAASGVNVSGFRGTAPASGEFMPAAFGPWAARYQTRYGVQPTLYSANAYDATYLVALAAQAAGTSSGTFIRAHIRDVASPPGTVIATGQWAIARQELVAGHDVDYNGASGSVNMNAFGDVPAGYIIWALNATNTIYTTAFFDEASVVAMLPNGYFPRVAAGMASIIPTDGRWRP